MYPEVRITLAVLALLAAAVSAFFAQRITATHLAVLKSWTKTEATIVAMPATDHIEVEIPAEPEPRRMILAPSHTLGLSLFKKTSVYLDPSDPQHAEFGGLLQMWLWPATLGLAAVVCLMLGATVARLGKTGSTEGWQFTAAPLMDAEIRVRPPALEWKAPLCWSLLGVAAIAVSVFSKSASIAPRAGVSVLGLLFMLAMFASALDRATMEIRADAKSVRKTSAFGWIDVPWEQIARLERVRTVPTTRQRGVLGYDMPFPGRTTESYSFVNRAGRALMSMSAAMTPAELMQRLLELCREKTGSAPEKKTLRVPDF